MLPVNPSQMAAMLKQLGIKMEEIKDVKEVIIKTEDKEILIEPADVKKMTGQGMITFQIIAAKVEEKETKETLEISEEDINILMEKASLSQEQAKKLLEKHSGDLAAALLEAEEQKN